MFVKIVVRGGVEMNSSKNFVVAKIRKYITSLPLDAPITTKATVNALEHRGIVVDTRRVGNLFRWRFENHLIKRERKGSEGTPGLWRRI